MKKRINNQGENQFERLLGLYLKKRSANRRENFAEHLDEDSLAAFVEGRLTKRNDLPIISHLVECSPCRRSTLELLSLTEQIEIENHVVVSSSEPSLFHEFWSKLKAKTFTSLDNTVFAHQERADDEDDLNQDADKE